jgi:hypothetical protein
LEEEEEEEEEDSVASEFASRRYLALFALASSRVSGRNKMGALPKMRMSVPRI